MNINEQLNISIKISIINIFFLILCKLSYGRTFIAKSFVEKTKVCTFNTLNFLYFIIITFIQILKTVQ